jgi:D-glycero-alpha-D-manno-heptose 1-phosphate guanylyltransferase
MAPIDGRPFLEYLLDYWITQGVTRFILAVGYKHEIIINHFKKTYKNILIDYSVEWSPMGTGGGLLQAAAKLNNADEFLLLNGDTYFAVPLSALIRNAKQANSDWCFSAFRTSEAQRYTPLEVSSTGRVVNLHSSLRETKQLINGGVYWVNTSSLGNKIEPKSVLSLEHDLFPRYLKMGQQLFAFEFPGPFIDIGVPQDYLRASSVIQG